MKGRVGGSVKGVRHFDGLVVISPFGEQTNFYVHHVKKPPSAALGGIRSRRRLRLKSKKKKTFFFLVGLVRNACWQGHGVQQCSNGFHSQMLFTRTISTSALPPFFPHILYVSSGDCCGNQTCVQELY